MNRYSLLVGRIALALGASFAVACGDGASATPAPECDVECRDGVALRALRETLKLVYNLTLQGKPVGEQDATTPCPLGGEARVTGFATSNPDQGANQLELEYTLTACAYLKLSPVPEENYGMGFQGSVRESGVLAVQPSSTTALFFTSDELTLVGRVYDPPLDYEAQTCALTLAQSGRNLSGVLCDRRAGLEL